MITSNEIGKVFGIMRASYGHLWPHEADAIDVWWHRLNKYTAASIATACDLALKSHPNKPPTLAQFDFLCRSMSEPEYKSLPSPEISREEIQAQLAMMKAIVALAGVDRQTLVQMIELKNALIEEKLSGLYETDFIEQVQTQLMALGENHDASGITT